MNLDVWSLVGGWLWCGKFDFFRIVSNDLLCFIEIHLRTSGGKPEIAVWQT